MTQRNIAIGIDPTRSTAGARVIKRDLDDIAAGAQKVENQTGRARDALGRFSSGAGTANDNVKKLAESSKTANSSLQGLANTLKAAGALFATLVGAAAITALVRYADTAKNLTSQLKLVTASSQELVRVQEQLYRLAQGSRSSYEATVQLYSKLARSAKDLGLSQDALLKITDTVNKAFVVSGATSQETENAIRQLAQGLSAGALRGDEFNAVAEQAPRLLQAVAEYLNMNVGQLRAYAAEGKITADVLAGALFKSAEKINGEFAKMEVTIGSASQVLQNSMIRAVGELDAKLGVSSAISAGIIKIAEGIDYLVENFDKLYKILQITSVILTAIFAESILTGVARLVTLVGTNLVGAFAALNAIILANPIVALIAAITAAVAAVYYFRDEIKKAIGVDVWGIIKATGNFIINSFSAAFEDVKFLWNTFPDIIEAAFIGGLNKMIAGLNAMNTKALEGINWFREKVGLDPIDPAGIQLKPHDNPAYDRTQESIEKRNERLLQIMQQDPLGAAYDWFNQPGSTPGTPPGLPGEGATLPAGLGQSGQSADQIKKYDEIVKGARQAIALQRLEAQTIGMTEQAARQLRIEQELLNKAANDNINLTPQQTQGLKDLAAEMADAEQKTKDLKESFEFNKGVFKGFFSDLKTGLQNGEGFFKSFANAALNAINKIIDRLMDKLLDSLFDSFFGTGVSGGTTAGGGIGATIVSALTGRAGGGTGTGTFAAPVTAVTRAALPDIGASSSAISGSGAQLAWNFWKSKGLADHQVAGILGNIKGESAFNPAAIGDGGDALGLYQWNDRSKSMLSSVGSNWRNNPLAQHEFAYKELMSSESRAWSALTNSKDVRGATGAFAGFERPSGFSWGNPEGAHNFSGRLNGAEEALKKFGGTTTQATEGLGNLGKGFSNFGNQLSSSFFPSAPGGGSFSLGNLFGSFSPFGAQATLAASGSIFGLFDGGGYTGDGGRKEVAGLVHRGEVVFNQDDVRRAGGPGRVDAMRRGLDVAPNESVKAANVNSMSVGDVYVSVPEGTDTKDSDRIGKEVRQQMIKLIDERLTDQQRTNGLLDGGRF